MGQAKSVTRSTILKGVLAFVLTLPCIGALSILVTIWQGQILTYLGYSASGVPGWINMLAWLGCVSAGLGIATAWLQYLLRQFKFR